ncbi:MAG: cyclodeaminase/cyclohydrolase family protein [Candidatus Omnitrophota bacterium]
MLYKSQSLEKYINDLGAKVPAPGGGSAAALCAAMAAALMSMAVNFTVGKEKYARYEEELKGLLNKAEKLKKDCLNLVDLDIVAYESKDMRKAMDVPLCLSRLCFEGIKILPELVNKANRNLISDVAVAAVFFEAAFSAARVNVEINLLMLDDKKLVKAVNNELAVRAKSVVKIRTSVERKVRKILKQKVGCSR